MADARAAAYRGDARGPLFTTPELEAAFEYCEERGAVLTNGASCCFAPLTCPLAYNVCACAADPVLSDVVRQPFRRPVTLGTFN